MGEPDKRSVGHKTSQATPKPELVPNGWKTGLISCIQLLLGIFLLGLRVVLSAVYSQSLAGILVSCLGMIVVYSWPLGFFGWLHDSTLLLYIHKLVLTAQAIVFFFVAISLLMVEISFAPQLSAISVRRETNILIVSLLLLTLDLLLFAHSSNRRIRELHRHWRKIQVERSPTPNNFNLVYADNNRPPTRVTSTTDLSHGEVCVEPISPPSAHGSIRPSRSSSDRLVCDPHDYPSLRVQSLASPMIESSQLYSTSSHLSPSQATESKSSTDTYTDPSSHTGISRSDRQL